MSTSQGTEGQQLTPALFKALHPRPYLDTFLSQGIRPDGRLLLPSSDSWSDYSINTRSISTAPASTLIRLGLTSLVCGLSLSVSNPDPKYPVSGFVVPNVDVVPLCGAIGTKVGPPGEESQSLSSQLNQLIISSGVLKLEELCIRKGEQVFVLHIDIIVLNHDGSILSACLLSLIGSLLTLRLPEPLYDSDSKSIQFHPLSPSHPGRTPSLSKRLPITISFGWYDEKLLVDPTAFEMGLCESTVDVTVGVPIEGKGEQEGELVGISQRGKVLPLGDLRRCVELARDRAGELCKALLESTAI